MRRASYYNVSGSCIGSTVQVLRRWSITFPRDVDGDSELARPYLHAESGSSLQPLLDNAQRDSRYLLSGALVDRDGRADDPDRPGRYFG